MSYTDMEVSGVLDFRTIEAIIFYAKALHHTNWHEFRRDPDSGMIVCDAYLLKPDQQRNLSDLDPVAVLEVQR